MRALFASAGVPLAPEDWAFFERLRLTIVAGNAAMNLTRLVSERDFYLDLLFYHLHLRCFVVVDLKKGEFKPEYAGKMNFYCSAVDDLLRREHDAPTIGLILCQTKDRLFAEYALRDIHKPIGLAAYELTRALPKELASSLPSIEQLEAELGTEGTP